jgi:hypothetical protein
MIGEVSGGVSLGAAFVVGARRQNGGGEARVYAVGLVMAALIYVGLALVGAAGLRWTAVEIAGGLTFGEARSIR